MTLTLLEGFQFFTQSRILLFSHRIIFSLNHGYERFHPNYNPILNLSTVIKQAWDGKNWIQNFSVFKFFMRGRLNTCIRGYLKCYMCNSNFQVTGKGQGYIHQGQSSRSIIMVDVNYYWKCHSHLFLFNSVVRLMYMSFHHYHLMQRHTFRNSVFFLTAFLCVYLFNNLKISSHKKKNQC